VEYQEFVRLVEVVEEGILVFRAGVAEEEQRQAVSEMLPINAPAVTAQENSDAKRVMAQAGAHDAERDRVI